MHHGHSGDELGGEDGRRQQGDGLWRHIELVLGVERQDRQNHRRAIDANSGQLFA
jgi:hypothetical protein